MRIWRRFPPIGGKTQRTDGPRDSTGRRIVVLGPPRPPESEATEHDNEDQENLPARRPDRNTETSTPEPPEKDNRPTPPKNAPIKLDDDLEIPVADGSGKANRKLPGRIYNAIEEKGRAKLGEVLESGTITTKGKRDKIVNIDVDLPSEAAKKLIEDVASAHDDAPTINEDNNIEYQGPDGTRWMARPRTSEDGRQGAEVQVNVPKEGGEAGEFVPRSIKMTFGESQSQSNDSVNNAP